MTTKAYRRFTQRIEAYNEDLELCDVLVRQFRRRPNSEASLAVLLGSTNDRHTHLGRRGNTRRSREICGAHLKNTLYAAYVKDLFEDFSAYLAESMTKAALKGINPQRFVGDVRLDISAAEVLAAGGWEATVRLLSDAIFRKLENERKTRDLITKASVRLGLQLEAARLDAAMPYLDARHMLVHRDGKPDDAYQRAYPAIVLRNGKLPLDFPFVSSAKREVSALALHIDQAIIAADLVRPQDISGQRQAAAV